MKCLILGEKVFFLKKKKRNTLHLDFLFSSKPSQYITKTLPNLSNPKISVLCLRLSDLACSSFSPAHAIHASAFQQGEKQEVRTKGKQPLYNWLEQLKNNHGVTV